MTTKFPPYPSIIRNKHVTQEVNEAPNAINYDMYTKLLKYLQGNLILTTLAIQNCNFSH